MRPRFESGLYAMDRKPNKSLLRNAGRSVRFPIDARFPAWQTCGVGRKMATDDKHKIRNSVIASLFTAAVVSLVVYLIPGGWASVIGWCAKITGAAVAWLCTSLEVPVWLIAILALAFAALVIAAAVIVLAIVRKSSDQIESFTEAEFFGIKWRWRYGQMGIYDIASFCPECDLQVHPVSASAYRAVDRVVYGCDECHWHSEEFEMSAAEVEDRVLRKIQQEIRRKNERKD